MTREGEILKAPELRLTWITGGLAAIGPAAIGVAELSREMDTATRALVFGLTAVVVIALTIIYWADVHTRASLEIAGLATKAEPPKPKGEDGHADPAPQLTATHALAEVSIEGEADVRYTVLAMTWNAEEGLLRYVVSREGHRPIVVDNDQVTRTYCQPSPNGTRNGAKAHEYGR